MHGPKEGTHENHKLQVLHVLVGLRRERPVIDHQHNAGCNQDEEEKEGDEAHVERVPELHILHLHFGRMDMQPHVEKDQFGLSLVGGQRIPPDDRLPDFAEEIHRHTINRYVGGTFLSLSMRSCPSRASVTSNQSSARGAGPCCTEPSAAKTLPWHGQWNFWSLEKCATVHPKWVQTALAAEKPLSLSRNM